MQECVEVQVAPVQQGIVSGAIGRQRTGVVRRGEWTVSDAG
jgi:hypothetical protein